MFIVRTGGAVTVHAPAKLNLHLEVLGRRSDGYHDLETLMTAIDVYDTLQFRSDASGKLTLSCRWAYGCAARAGQDASMGVLPPQEANTVFRAVDLLRKRAGISAGATIELVKRIPSEAGLGGASSDAAAALVAANEAWQLGWSREKLAELAGEVGSDIPFFLYCGTAICRGRGERIEPVLGGSRLNYVVVRPPEGLSTAVVFRHCRPAQTAESVEPIRAAIAQESPQRLARRLLNRLEEPASRLSPWVKRVKNELERVGSLGAGMSGSGSSCYGIFRHRRAAQRAGKRLRAARLGVVFAAATAAHQT